jgi:hypothetical protein
MKPLVYGLAGAGVLIALVAGPVAGQARPGGPPGGGGGGGGGGGAAMHAGGGSSGGPSGGGSVGGSGSSGSSGGGHAVVSTGSSGGASQPSSGTTPSSGSSYGSSGRSGATPRGGIAWSSNPVNGNSPVVRRLYGSPGDNAVPRGARPYGSSPYGSTSYVGPITGHAVPRQPGNGVRGGRPNHGGGVYGGGGGHDINWGYAPWMFAGLGFYDVLYADPYWLAGYWFPYDYGYDYDSTWDPTEAGGGGYSGDLPVGVGGLRLKVEPTSAEVLVDGYYMGTVDDFNGVFQKMDLTSGPHHVEIRAPGFRPITFDVRIEPNDTVTYRGELQLLAKR